MSAVPGNIQPAPTAAELAKLIAKCDTSSNGCYGEVRTLRIPTPKPAGGSGHEVRAWDGVSRGSPAEEYLKKAGGGLDAVRGDSWHYRQASSVQEGIILEIEGHVIGKLIGPVVGAASALVPMAKEAAKTAFKAASESAINAGKTASEAIAIAGKAAGEAAAKALNAAIDAGVAASNTVNKGIAAAKGLYVRRATGVTFKGKLYRYTEPKYKSSAWDVHDGNIAANHRYTPPGEGGVYAGTSAETSLAEISHYKSPGGLELVSKDVSITNMLDLNNPAVRDRLGVSLTDITADSYSVTHRIGEYARAEGYNGIIAPSARNPGGSNVIIFKGP